MNPPFSVFSAQTTPQKGRLFRLRKNPFVLTAIFAVVLLTAARYFIRPHQGEPPVIAQLPEFTLTNQAGQPFGSQQLKGQTYVADFIFTRCRSVCPLMSKRMRLLQDRFDAAGLPISLVSVSVDPVNDSPSALQTYGDRYGAKLPRWNFLTGKLDDIKNLIDKGFLLNSGDKLPNTGDIFDISHAQKFVVVDGNGAIRGYHDSTVAGMDEVFVEAERVYKTQQNDLPSLQKRDLKF